MLAKKLENLNVPSEEIEELVLHWLEVLEKKRKVEKVDLTTKVTKQVDLINFYINYHNL